MKIAIALLTIVGLASSQMYFEPYGNNFADENFLAKQKFLFEIVYRVDEPLAFEDWIKLAKSFTFNTFDYNTQVDVHIRKFYDDHIYGATLPKGEFFSALVKSHLDQAKSLFNLFYYANNWQIFQSSVAWARMHSNEGMFVYALTLAVSHRYDCSGLVLPSINEIFPQYFFNSKLVSEAEKFDYNVWSKHIMHEKEYKDMLYKDYSALCHSPYTIYHCNTKDFKTWQWYKMMDLDKRWYSEEHCIMRENIDDSQCMQLLAGIKMFFMPVDYSRDVAVFHKESALSYFTEDVGLNVYWYNLNIDYAFFLNAKPYNLAKVRHGEYWFYKVRQVLARYYAERLSHGYGKIPEFYYLNVIEHGYNPQLVHYNGVGFSYRRNYYEIQSYGKFDKIMDFFNRMNEIITKGVYVTYDGKTIDLRNPESIEYIADMMQGNADSFDEYFFKDWYLFAHNYFGGVNTNDYKVLPNVFLNYETMMRDPFFYMFYKEIATVYYRFFHYVKPYTREELLFPGVTINNVKVSELVTYFDLLDFDVTNLLNDKMTFVDGQFVWHKTLLARQKRLNHKPFDFEFNITVADRSVGNVVIRTYLAPKYDEVGRTISLNENRQNFMEIDAFLYTLAPGVNIVKRRSKDFYSTAADRTTYTELYKYVMLALHGKYNYPLDVNSHSCGFPDRLLLPRGWNKGMPMQLFFHVSRFFVTFENMVPSDYPYSCDFHADVRYIRDDNRFGFPFDREIDEQKFFVPNMYLKDVNIFHQNTFDKSYE